MTQTVAFLGLGNMGAAMAANVARAGIAVRGFNRTRTKAEALAARAPIEVSASPADAAAGADVIVTMVADADAVLDLYGGPDGVLSAAGRGAIAVEMSTIGVTAVDAVREVVHAGGLRMVDAPVSGSVATAERAALTIMVGGDADDVAAARPVLEAIGTPVIHMGALGAGQAMKLAVNSVVYGLAQAVSESLVLAERAGIERTRAYEVFMNSAVAAPMVAYRRGAYESPETTPAAFRLELAAKDLELIVGLARQVGARVPQAHLNLREIERAVHAGFGASDLAAVAQYLRASVTD